MAVRIVKVDDPTAPVTPVTQRSASLLQVQNLTVDLPVDGEVVSAVRGVSYAIDRGEIVAAVGESGSGKTVGALAVLGLLPPSARIGGRMIFDGQDLQAMSANNRRRVRSNRIAMVFQDAMSALNPVRSIGSQLVEVIREHQPVSRMHARRLAVAALDRVHIAQADRRFSALIHELSGGMRQRVMIAMATVNHPDLLIADEPTTALDVTVAAQVLDMLARMREEDGTAILLISHDLPMVAGFADRVLVMYGGTIVETATTGELFGSPAMPYSVGLLACTPTAGVVQHRLRTIAGSPPSLAQPPAGCPFHPRCPLAIDVCRTETPALVPIAAQKSTGESTAGPIAHLVACHRSADVRNLDDPAAMFSASIVGA